MTKWLAALLLVACAGAVERALLQPDAAAQSRPQALSAGGDARDVFTPAHRTTVEAVREFLGLRPTPVQPIAFPHNVHTANRLGCTDYCHASATVGPVAGLPGVKTCMICHGTIATDRAEVQKVAAYQERGEDIAWQRVYGYPRSAHVRFNHAPHVRAGVQCATCHGDVARQIVATRSMDLTMGFCVSCHRERSAPTDCMTCHF